jgi:hypothetical protein
MRIKPMSFYSTLIILIFTVFTVGCATYPTATSSASEVSSSKRLTDLYAEPFEGSGQIVVKRDRGLQGSACATRVYLNGIAVADLRVGVKVTLHVSPGNHIIGTEALGICYSGSREVAVEVNSGEIKPFRISFLWSDFVLQPTAF